MSTQRQKRVARLLVENQTLDKPLNSGEIVEKSRYSRSVVIKPSQVLNSKGVQEELQVLGFTEEGAKRVVSEILHNPDVEPNARLKAADMTFKVHGSYAPEKSVSVSVDVTNQNDETLADLLNATIRGIHKEPPTVKGLDDNGRGHKPSEGIETKPMGGEVQHKE